MKNIRNFSIIAHIDHGKSTLADRFLEITGTLRLSEDTEQVLDSMDLERERGITIKMHPVRMEYELNGEKYILNLIDTPGHVDFNYEVSRSLAACEGAILLVDATQGVEAQTISNLYLALEQNLEIIPVINKIDLPNADPERVKEQLIELLGEDQILEVSAKEGWGVEELIKTVVERVPPPEGDPQKPLKALIFDAKFDDYRGAVPFVRVFEGEIKPGMKIAFKSNGKVYEVTEVGYFRPKLERTEKLVAGEVGYVIAGIKDLRDARVGDTIVDAKYFDETEALPGYREPKPMVYAGVYPTIPSEFPELQKALEKLKLNDAALVYQGETSPALGPGYRVGFLGLLHMEIFKERLKREFDLEVIITTPNVKYRVELNNGEIIEINSPKDFPDDFKRAFEPFVKAEIITPQNYIGPIVELCQSRRGIQKNMQYLDRQTMIIEYELPLAEVIFDFFDKLKSVSRGFASLDYEFLEYRESDLVRLDILVAREKIDALAVIVHREKAYYVGRELVTRLRKLIPRQLFDVAIQAAIGKRVIAKERIPALRKDVTAKCYGGDITRKRKLLEKQKEGKKRLKKLGKVELPHEAFLGLMKVDENRKK